MTRHTKPVASRHAARGFTLIELMVVVVIAAILAAIAIPSYRNHVIRTHRSAAEAFMSQVANKQEQIMLDARQYVGVLNNAAFVTAPPTGLNLAVPPDVDSTYNLSVAASSVTGSTPVFTIVATPKAAAQVDTQCNVVTLDATGKKTCNGSACAGGYAAVCWQ